MNAFSTPPEFVPLHANGNAESVFDRIDWKPSEATTLHLNLSAARSWLQVPNTYDQQAADQDQRQHMTSFNVDIGISHAKGVRVAGDVQHLGPSGSRQLFSISQSLLRSASNAPTVSPVDKYRSSWRHLRTRMDATR